MVGIFSLATWFAVKHATTDELNEISSEYVSISDEAKMRGFGQLPEILSDHARQRSALNPVYLLERPDGAKVAGNIGQLPPRLGAQRIPMNIAGSKAEIRAHGYTLKNGDYLLIGQQTPVLREMETLIFRTFGYGLALTLVLALIGGAVISTRLLGRVEAVSRTAQSIVGHNLSKRVPVSGTNDEFDHLAASINDMLDRIEGLMQNVRQVSNDIAHDLRTPLTRLRYALEEARDNAASTDEFRQAVTGSMAQLDSILETFSALLRIAQIETGDPKAAPSTVDLSALLNMIVEDFTPAVHDSGKSLSADIQPGLSTQGDAELLAQMVINLIDNALRHSSSGARIMIEANYRGEQIELSVADNGVGIPMCEREKVLQPFYRLDASRSTPGHGLGLSLVAAIAKWHRAKLELSDNRPGLRVAVEFTAAMS